MPVYTSSIEVTADYPTIKPSLNLNFARSRSLDPRITFTRASTATYIGRDGLVKYAGEDEPRFDHDPDTLESLGLLIEDSRTNYITNSQAPLSAAGSGNLSGGALTTSVAVSTISPDGTTNGVARFNGDGTYRFGFANSGIAQQAYAGSIWVRAVSGTASFAIDVNDYNNLGYDAGLQTVGEEWQRFVVVSQRPDTQPYRFMDINLDNSDVYIWGPQLEEGYFPTSYIPTSGSAASRAGETATINSPGLDDFSSRDGYTLTCEVKHRQFIVGSYPSIGFGTDVNNWQQLRFYRADGGNPRADFSTRSGGTFRNTGVVTLASGSSNQTTPIYNKNQDMRYAFSLNSTSIQLDLKQDGFNHETRTATFAAVNWEAPNTFQLHNAATYGSSASSPLNGTIGYIRYYPKRLSDNQIQALLE